MAKKKASLLDAVNEMPDAINGYGWMTQLKQRDPDFCSELVDIVRRFVQGDEKVRNKFPHRIAFCDWITEQLAAHGYGVPSDRVVSWFDREKHKWRS